METIAAVCMDVYAGSGLLVKAARCSFARARPPERKELTRLSAVGGRLPRSFSRAQRSRRARARDRRSAMIADKFRARLASPTEGEIGGFRTLFLRAQI